MSTELRVEDLAFTDERIMGTSDIDVLREAYGQLLQAYHGEIRGRVLAEMRLEDVLSVVEG